VERQWASCLAMAQRQQHASASVDVLIDCSVTQRLLLLEKINTHLYNGYPFEKWQYSSCIDAATDVIRT
jgi:hypothetical protein